MVSKALPKLLAARFACVLVNVGDTEEEATVEFEEGDSGFVQTYQPFQEPKASASPTTINIPPE
jgi:hypothetical protein